MTTEHCPFSLPRVPLLDPVRVVELSMRISNRAVLEDLDDCAPAVLLDGTRWHDTRPMLDPREHAPEVLDMALQALELGLGTGLLLQHPGKLYLVRPAPRAAQAREAGH
jgi:hypothetical protein